MEPLLIDGDSLKIENVHEVAFDRRRVGLHPAAAKKMAQSRAVIDAIVTENRAVYGVSTGFGKLSDVHISREEITQLQHNLVRSHASGMGDPFSEEEVRALMLLRANVLAKGLSGARPAVAERLCDLLNHHFYPVIPCRGSVGASGDLAPLAHLALVLIGEGESTFAGERLPGAAALARAGLEPLALSAKEGLALINGTHLMAAPRGPAVREAERLVDAAIVATALSLEAFKGSTVPFDPRLHALRPQPGQRAVAERLRTLLAGSAVVESHADCGRVQDPYTLRCAPQVIGAVADAVAYVAGALERELEAVTDKPL